MSPPDTPPAAGARFLRSRRDILVGGALLAAAGTAFARKPRLNSSALGDAKLESIIPNRFEGWKFETTSGLVLPPQDQLSDTIYSQILSRVYSREDDSSVMLLIAYSSAQDGVIQVHRPEVCYPASGFRLVENRPYTVSLAANRQIPTRFIVAESPVRREQMVYWTRIGHHFPARWLDQRIAVAEENLAGIIPDGVLVRVSALADGDARPLLNDFLSALFRSVPDRMKRVLVGS